MANYDGEQDERVTKLARHQPDVALTLAEDLVARFPSVSRSWASLAYVQTVRKDYYGALDSMEMAIRVNPGEPANLFHISRIYMNLYLYRDAILNLSECIKISYGIGNSYYSESCYFYRAVCFCRIGNFCDAEDDLRRVADEGTFWVGRSLTKADLKEACRRKRLD